MPNVYSLFTGALEKINFVLLIAWRGIVQAASWIKNAVSYGITWGKRQVLRAVKIAIAELRWATFLCKRHSVQAFRWLVHRTIYFLAIVSAILSVYVLPSPFIFGLALWTPIDDVPQQAGWPAAWAALQGFFTRPTGYIFELAQSSLPRKCSQVAGDWGHFSDHPCFKASVDGAVQYAQLAAFDTVFHAVFAFCIGFGIIFEAGELAGRELRKLKGDIRTASKEIQDTVAGVLYSDELTFAEWAANSHAQFESFMKKCVRFCTWTSYSCLITTGFMTGFLMMVSPWHDGIVLPHTFLAAFYAFAAAPFVSAFAVVIVVMMILAGRVAYPGRITSRANWIVRENENVRRLLQDLAQAGQI